MGSNRRREALRTALAVAVGVIFVYAAAPKILNPAEFAMAVRRFKIPPLWSANLVAVLMPWWELGAGLALFLPGLRKPGALTVFGMTCLFAAAVVSAIIRGFDISCGCFGPDSAAVGAKTLALDAGILIATGLVLWLPPRADPSTQQPERSERS